VAAAENRAIGKGGRLPWRLPADLRHFKELTTGQTVLMGRKTFESIGRPLPGRENFVVSRTPDPVRRGHVGGPEATLESNVSRSGPGPVQVRFFSSIDEALASVRTGICFVIGGAEIYRQTLGRADGIWLTRVPGRYEADAFYPEIPADFREVSRRPLEGGTPAEVIFYERADHPARVEKAAGPVV
jgi:dihydrofolate reductase